MEPLDRSYTTYYWSSYMTLNNIMTLKYGLEGHPRSLKMVPLESVGMISYLPSIVTMAVYLAISVIFNGDLTVKSGFAVVQSH